MKVLGKALENGLTRSALINVVIRIAALPLGLVVTMLLTRALSINDFGAYTFLFGIITIMSMPVQSSLSTLNIRHIAINYDARNYEKLRGLAVYALFLTLSVLGLVFLIAQIINVAGLFKYDYFFNNIYLIFLISFLIILLGYIGSVLRGFHHTVLGVLPEQVIRPIFFILFLSLAWLSSDITFNKVMALNIISYSLLFSVFISLYIVFKFVPGKIFGLKLNIEYVAWNKTIVTLLLLSAVQVFNTNVPILTLGILSDNEDVAIYRVASQFATLSGLGLIAVNFVIGPKIAKEYANNNLKTVQSYLTTGSFTILFITLPIALFFILFGSNALNMFFGEEYLVGSEELTILCFAQIINAFGGSVGITLNMLGKEKYTFFGMLSAAFANGISCYLLIPGYGATGAAYASLISIAVWNAILCWSLYVKTGLLTIPIPRNYSKTR